MSKKLRKIKFTSENGDMHFIYDENSSSKLVVENGDCDEYEARKVSKLEASKPLLLVRE